MKIIADLHIHSKYSRATSRSMDLETIDKWARTKGINVVGTGDFSHPEWFKSIKEKLEAAETGLFKPKDGETRFMLSNEISCIYSKNRKVRKIHVLIFAPSLAVVEEINARLGWVGNLKSDGRPILGMDVKELTEIVLGVSEDCLIVPAHLMTPWFSLFGSKSGFDSVEECFEEYSDRIFAGETGLSADPEMLWRIPDGRRIALISNSDAHSPAKLGREANVFDTELSYRGIIEAIKTKDQEKFLYTIEFYPEGGRYHFDGHRNCEVRFSPEETKKHNGMCPVCGRPVTVGVLNRVGELADRKRGFVPKKVIPFKSLVPLEEIIADVFNQGAGTKKVEKEYNDLIEKLGSEFDILLDVKRDDLEEATIPEIAEAIMRVRKGEIHKEPGYDGVYGKVDIFGSNNDKKKASKQDTLF